MSTSRSQSTELATAVQTSQSVPPSPTVALVRGPGRAQHQIPAGRVHAKAESGWAVRDREQRAAEARQALDVQAKELEAMGARVDSRTRAKRGPAHRKILARAERTRADLIVLGSRVRESGYVTRLGSTADRVLRTSPVPSLVVRGDGALPCRRVAALVDFSSIARGAVRLTVDWLPALGGGAPPAEDRVATIRSNPGS